MSIMMLRDGKVGIGMTLYLELLAYLICLLVVYVNGGLLFHTVQLSLVGFFLLISLIPIFWFSMGWVD